MVLSTRISFSSIQTLKLFPLCRPRKQYGLYSRCTRQALSLSKGSLRITNRKKNKVEPIRRRDNLRGVTYDYYRQPPIPYFVHGNRFYALHMQFAESIFTKKGSETANCLSDWPIFRDLIVKLLSANHNSRHARLGPTERRNKFTRRLESVLRLFLQSPHDTFNDNGRQIRHQLAEVRWWLL